MPGMSGRDLANQLTAADADLKVIFMSGYPDDVVTELGVLSPETNYLQKPFNGTALLETLARVIETSAVARTTAEISG